MLRFLWRFVAFLAEMNGNTPFFQALFKANLAIIVGGLSRSEWVGMLRFRHLVKHIKTAFVMKYLDDLPVTGHEHIYIGRITRVK